MEIAKLSSKGQIVLPKAIRQTLQVAAGSQLGFETNREQVTMSVVRKKTAKAGDGFGLLKDKGKAIPPERAEATMSRTMKKGTR